MNYVNSIVKIALIFSLGSSIGSFAGLVITRIPLKESITGRSKCMGCGLKLPITRNIPVLGFIFSQGKCLNCNARIPPYYLISEIWLGLAFVYLYYADMHWIKKLAWLNFLVFGLILSGVDLKTRKLPNFLNLYLFSMSFIITLISAVITLEFEALKRAYISVFIYVLLFLIINLISRGGIGVGDAKFAASIGLLLGYAGWLEMYLGFIIAFALGSLFSIVGLLLKVFNRKSRIAFGPFMYIGAICAASISPSVRNLLS